MGHVKTLLVVAGLALAGCTPGLARGTAVPTYFMGAGDVGEEATAALATEDTPWLERNTLGDLAPRGALLD